MPFNLFHKKKTEFEESTVPPQEEAPQQTAVSGPEASTVNQPEPEAQKESTNNTPPVDQEVDQEPQESQQTPTAHQEPTTAVEQEPEILLEQPNKTYLKAMPLKELSDVEKVKDEVQNGNIIILRITSLANKSIEEVKTAVNELFTFAEETGGDIARLGEERVVICPKNIRIWREKTLTPIKSDSEPLPTAA